MIHMTTKDSKIEKALSAEQKGVAASGTGARRDVPDFKDVGVADALVGED